jgi:hypothetical protein
MMKNKVEDVRNHLVAAMEALNEDGAKPEEIAQAIEKGKAMSGLATAYIAAVKVEMDAIRLAEEVGMLPASITPPTQVKTLGVR